jgi:AraC-like DNA-binding protein
MFYLFGLSVAFFLFVLILLKKNKQRSDFILLAWIGIIVVHLALFILHHTGIVYQYPYLLGVGLPLPILHGLFLYFYTVELIHDHPLRMRSASLHLVPFIIMTVLAIPFYVLSAEEKIAVFKNEGRGFEWYMHLQMVVFLVAGFAYSIASIAVIRKHQKLALNTYSNLDKKMLRWLEYLAIGLAIIWLVSAFSGEVITFAAVVLFVLFIGFFGISQFPVFHSVSRPPGTAEAQPGPEAPTEMETGKYRKSKLGDPEAVAVMELLEKVMVEQKPYAKAELTLNDLAAAIQVSPNDLSQVINTLAGKTFYHYINTYRIHEFLKLATQPQSRKFTYLGLAYQCGFTSKTTFNKYFKLHTGKTPSEYFEEAPENLET